MAEISQVQNLPAPFIEAAGQTYLQELQSAIGDLKGQDLSTILGPQFVAKPGALTQQAQSLAGGLGSFAPFLQTAAATTGPQAYQQFLSPFQQDVIKTTLDEFDVQAAKGLPSLRAQAIGAGAFGGGREGVQLAEYQSASDRNRAALQAQLLQSGFGQAQAAAQQQFLNQLNLAQQAPALAGQQISALSALGTQQQAQQQAELSAQQQLLQQQMNRPLNLAQQLGQGVMGLISGYPAQFQTQTTPSPSPLQTALGAGATLAGVYRAFS
jgi:small neutral amino acid transporter SnatA (MarC family)|tara:strand:- start:182 stop:985 length:804 start_codon:yes stop_codon:yes gene_type:complete